MKFRCVVPSTDAFVVHLGQGLTKCIYVEKQRRMPCVLGTKTFPRASTFITSTIKCHYTPRKLLKTTDGLTASHAGSIVATMESTDKPKLQHAIFRQVFCSIPLKAAAQDAGISFWRAHKAYHNLLKTFQTACSNILATFKLSNGPGLTSYTKQ